MATTPGVTPLAAHHSRTYLTPFSLLPRLAHAALDVFCDACRICPPTGNAATAICRPFGRRCSGWGAANALLEVCLTAPRQAYSTPACDEQGGREDQQLVVRA